MEMIPQNAGHKYVTHTGTHTSPSRVLCDSPSVARTLWREVKETSARGSSQEFLSAGGREESLLYFTTSLDRVLK